MPEYLDLVLSVKVKNWREEDPESYAEQAEFRLMREKVLNRDGRRCRFCGFLEVAYPEVHHLDDDHHNNNIDNLVTADAWCHQVHHVGFTAKNGTAELAWMPKTPQRYVNHIMRTLSVARFWEKNAKTLVESNQNRNLRGTIEAIENILKERVQIVEQRFGSSSPRILANALLMMDQADPQRYQHRKSILSGLVLLPTGKFFRQNKDITDEVIGSWLSEKNSKQGLAGAYAGLSPRTWQQLLNSYIADLGKS